MMLHVRVVDVPSGRFFRCPFKPSFKAHLKSQRTMTFTVKGSFFDGFLRNIGKLGKEDLSMDLNDGDLGDEPSFVPLDPSSETGLDGNSEDTFGPLALLAVGFLEEEFRALKEILNELGAEQVLVIPGTPAMLQATLGEALSVESPPPYQPPLASGEDSNEQSDGDTKKVVFLSGMYAGEVIDVVATIRESDLPDIAFAAALPKNWKRNLGELIQDVFADHSAMQSRNIQVVVEEEDDEER